MSVKKKVLTIPLEDEEVVELYQILLDRDAEEALVFLQKHVRGQVRELLDNRAKVKVNRARDEAEEG